MALQQSCCTEDSGLCQLTCEVLSHAVAETSSDSLDGNRDLERVNTEKHVMTFQGAQGAMRYPCMNALFQLYTHLSQLLPHVDL